MPNDISTATDRAHARTGMLYAALAYIAWGLFPLYFKRLSEVNALEVIAHRTVWSLVFVALVLAACGAGP
ncbi:hypothetical protein FUT87_28110, partial [Mitsuaria sp. TWR114]